MEMPGFPQPERIYHFKREEEKLLAQIFVSLLTTDFIIRSKTSSLR